jgi:hypothetical protein
MALVIVPFPRVPVAIPVVGRAAHRWNGMGLVPAWLLERRSNPFSLAPARARPVPLDRNGRTVRADRPGVGKLSVKY